MKTRGIFQLLLAASVAVALVACDKDDTVVPQSDSVIIGSQEWTRYNLDVDTFRNGDIIPEARSAEEWREAGQARRPAWCYYDNDPQKGELYGRLYNYYAVIDPRGLAPEGWHVSTGGEWDTMIEYLGGFLAAQEMKSTHLWLDDGGGNNSSGFSALPGSYRDADGIFLTGNAGLGYVVLFWSSSRRYYLMSTFNFGYWKYLEADSRDMGALGAYVRCVRGNEDKLSTPIGTQLWRPQNLNVDTFRNGEPIPYAPTAEEWAAAADQKRPAWCYYLNDPANGFLYGRLYNWYAVTDPRGLAPKGMHIPDASEWMVLEQHLNQHTNAGSALKSISGWDPLGAWATNSTGFTALPGQMRFETGLFYEGPKLTLFWSSDETDEQTAIARGLHADSGDLTINLSNKGAGLSIRCLQD